MSIRWCLPNNSFSPHRRCLYPRWRAARGRQRGGRSNPLLTSFFRRLDRIPPVLAIGTGLILGALSGALLASQSPGVGLVGFVLVFGLAAGLAYSGEPIAVPIEEGPDSTDEASEGNKLWVHISGGRFNMGSNEHEREQPIHAVTISPFLCMRTPVTRRLYLEVMGADPSEPEGMADERPVNNVRWFDAIAFCNRWSELAGLTSCYVIDGDNVTWDTTKDGYRLLTEAEWEYACRAGSEGRWCFGDEEEKLSNYAWFRTNSNNQTQPVRQKRSNAWGLYDMHGNGWEWCWDWYSSYSSESQTDPTGSNQGPYRVLRGGAFNYGPWDLRSANRYRFRPEFRGVVGLRCARAPRRQY
jgi:formylglycine-generating enzyme required for sulfatase activity